MLNILLKEKWKLWSERSESEKATSCMIPTYDILEKAKLGDSKKIHGCQGLEGGRGE